MGRCGYDRRDGLVNSRELCVMSSDRQDMDENHRWIETGLTASFDHIDLRDAPGHPRYRTTTPRWSRKTMSPLAGLSALFTTKAAAAAAIVLTAAGGGVAVKAVTTGDPNPLNWGSTVTQSVQSCKAALTAGEHGIGSCVSSTANQHGQQERQAQASSAPAHATGQPTTTPAHATGQPSATPAHPTGQPSTTPAHPTGPPAGTVTGQPGSTTSPAQPTSHPTGAPSGEPYPTSVPTPTH